MANVDILVGEKIKLSIVPTLADLDADLLGTPTWVAADPTVVHLLPAPDGRTCEVTGKKAGSSLVTANAVGASALSANHTVVVAASNLADAITLSVENLPS